MEGVRIEEQGTDFMGNGLLWKTDRGLVEMDNISGGTT
jgi:succinate dehydrogenase flavin-adding protein (antitoxin of CptAB toxin-antitoxin module)